MKNTTILNYLLLLIYLIAFYSSNIASAAPGKYDVSDVTKAFSGKKITIVAPASGDSNTLSLLKSLNGRGLNLNIPDHCFCSPTDFHSASDEIRVNCFKQALLDDSYVLWALRGGYGCAKLIDKLNEMPKPSQEKIFIGYSDNTAMHLFLTQKWGWKTIHGSGIGEMVAGDKSKENFIKISQILSGKNPKAKISGLVPINNLAKYVTNINSSLTGGNLSIVETSIGTNWQIVADNKILFLEDLNIKPYQLDRILLHLRQASILKNVTAIIFGDINDNNKDILSVIKSFAQQLDIPVFKCERFGHRIINDPIIYNTKSTLRKDGTTYSIIMEF